MSFAVPALLQPNRRPAAASPAQTLLLPTDGSPAEEAAIGYVIEMARTAPVTVHLVNVQPAVMAGEVTLFTSAQMVTLQRSQRWRAGA